MKLIEKIQCDLKQILSAQRYSHSIGVMEMAVELAKLHNVDIESARIAGLLHDNAKEMSKEKGVNLTRFQRKDFKTCVGDAPANVKIK